MMFTTDTETIASFPPAIIQQAREAGAAAAIVEVDKGLKYLFAYRWHTIQAIWTRLVEPDKRPELVGQMCESIENQTGIDYRKQLISSAHKWDARLHVAGGKVFREMIRAGKFTDHAWGFWDSLVSKEDYQPMTDTEYLLNKSGSLMLSFIQSALIADTPNIRKIFLILSSIHKEIDTGNYSPESFKGRGMVVLIHSAKEVLTTMKGEELFINTAKQIGITWKEPKT